MGLDGGRPGRRDAAGVREPLGRRPQRQPALRAAAGVFLAFAISFRRGLTVGSGAAIGAALAVGALAKPTMLGLAPGVALGLLLLVVRAEGGDRRAAVRRGDRRGGLRGGAATALRTAQRHRLGLRRLPQGLGRQAAPGRRHHQHRRRAELHLAVLPAPPAVHGRPVRGLRARGRLVRRLRGPLRGPGVRVRDGGGRRRPGRLRARDRVRDPRAGRLRARRPSPRAGAGDVCGHGAGTVVRDPLGRLPGPDPLLHGLRAGPLPAAAAGAVRRVDRARGAGRRAQRRSAGGIAAGLAWRSRTPCSPSC